jgi:hypothetical protein
MTDCEFESLLGPTVKKETGAKYWSDFGLPVIDPDREYLLEMACRIEQQNPGANSKQVEKAVGLPAGSLAKYKLKNPQYKTGKRTKYFLPQWSFKAPDMSDFIPTLLKQNMTKTQLDITAKKYGGTAESRTAFDRIKKDIKQDKEKIYDLVADAWPEGMTTKELAGKLNKATTCISGRLTDLKMEARIIKIGKRNGNTIYKAKWVQ